MMYSTQPGMPSRRLFHLDALRCFCMLFGIMVHGSTIGDEPVFEIIRDASDLFRMATFFTISGYFTAYVASRSDLGGFIANRRDVLVYPLVASLVLLVPVTRWLIFCYFREPVSLHSYVSEGLWRRAGETSPWHLHLWFLFSLLLYAVLTPKAIRIGRSAAVAAGLNRLFDFAGRHALWPAALATGIGCASAQGVYLLIATLLPLGPFDWILRASLNYLPFYAVGLLAFLYPRLFERLHTISPVGIALSGALLHLFDLYRAAGGGMAPSRLASLGYWASHGMFMLFIVAALMALFRRFLDRPSATLSFLVDAAFSFYLFHMTVIFMIADLLLPRTGNHYLIFAVIVLAGTPLILAIHAFVIRPVPLLRLMFNGKRPRPAAEPGAVSAEPASGAR